MSDPLASWGAPSPFASSSSSSQSYTVQPAPSWPSTPHSPDFGKRAVTPTPAPSTPTMAIPGPYTDQHGREPRIYGQPEPGLISPTSNTLSNGRGLERSEPYVRIRLTALDRNRRDILIRFDAQTNLQNFTGGAYRNVSRSYVEFQRFAEQIAYSNPQTIVPALPLAQTSAPTDEEDDRLVKIMLQRWLTRICEDPVVIHDEELRSFIESDFGYQPTIRPKRKTSTGFSLLRRGVPDEDEELMAARYELTRLETQFFDAAKTIDKLSNARKALAAAEAEMGNKLISVASTEAHPQLANALRGFGRTWHVVADSEQTYSVGESVIIGDTLGYQGMNSKSAKDTLLSRAQALEEAQTAAKTTINKRRQIERLKASSNIRAEKVDEALEELEEAQQFENILARRVNGISQNLRRAIVAHSKNAHDDITAALIEHARASLIHERTVRRELEAVRAEVRKIGEPIRNVVPAPAPGPPQLGLGASGSMPGTPRMGAPPVDRGYVPSLGPASGPSSSAPSPSASVHPSLPLPGPVPVSASAAGPSSSASSSNPHSRLPNGGRPLDGTQSMVIPPQSPLARSSPGPALSSFSRSMTNTPTPTSASSGGAFDPLSQSLVVGPSSASNGMYPGQGQQGGGTMRGTFGSAAPQRSRIDDREAARKLANFL